MSKHAGMLISHLVNLNSVRIQIALRKARASEATFQTPQVCPTPDDVTVEMCVWVAQARLLIHEPMLPDLSTAVRFSIVMCGLAL